MLYVGGMEGGNGEEVGEVTGEKPGLLQGNNTHVVFVVIFKLSLPRDCSVELTNDGEPLKSSDSCPSSVLSFHADLRTLGLMRHKASLLGQQGRARFGLFDQLNAAVDGEHFLSLSAGLPGISNTHTHECKHNCIYTCTRPTSSVLLFFLLFF